MICNHLHRIAKKKLDDYSFYGGSLHVSYAPEYESVNETREKLQERRKVVAAKIRKLGKYQKETSHLLALSISSFSPHILQQPPFVFGGAHFCRF